MATSLLNTIRGSRSSHIRYSLSIVFIVFFSGYSTDKGTSSFPYHLAFRDASTVASGIVLAGTGILYDHLQEHRYSPPERSYFSRNQVPIFDRAAASQWHPSANITGDIFLGGLLLSAPVVAGYNELHKRQWSNLLTLAGMYSETILFSYAVSTWSKLLITRYRPYNYNEELSETTWKKMTGTEDAHRSFFSRHTALAFSSSMFLNTVAGDLFGRTRSIRILQATSLTVATGIGISRVVAGEHFPSDVLAGAAVGSLIGTLFPYLHRATSVLKVNSSGNGVTVTWNLK